MKKVRIVNINKFIRSVSILLGIIIFIIILLSKASFSHNDKEIIEYKSESVIAGDTLWNIAANEQQYNPYYEGKDIRDIIYNIKQVNNLKNANLSIGQELKIPTI